MLVLPMTMVVVPIALAAYCMVAGYHGFVTGDVCANHRAACATDARSNHGSRLATDRVPDGRPGCASRRPAQNGTAPPAALGADRAPNGTAGGTPDDGTSGTADLLPYGGARRRPETASHRRGYVVRPGE